MAGGFLSYCQRGEGIVDSKYQALRDLVLDGPSYEFWLQNFEWPDNPKFNWALDFFDPMAKNNTREALRFVDEESGTDTAYTYNDLYERSNRGANFLKKMGVGRGDCILLLVGHHISYWDISLAAMKVGAIILPVNPHLTAKEISERAQLNSIKMIVARKHQAKLFELGSSDIVPLVVDDVFGEWHPYTEVFASPSDFTRDSETLVTDPLYHYFVSTLAVKPKKVELTMGDATVGHLSTLFWSGIRPGDVHLGISTLGWGIHDWNNFIVPLSAEATVLIYEQKSFSVARLLRAMSQYKVTTLCATPTFYRMLAHAELAEAPNLYVREALGTGGELGQELLSKISNLYGLNVREGYSLTELPIVMGVPPRGKLGCMKGFPGFDLQLKRQDSGDGELCVVPKYPWGDGSVVKTGEYANLNDEGNYQLHGRRDGIFKTSDFRISPVELEEIVRSFPSVRDVIVVPSYHPLREAVPKAFVSLAEGFEPSAELAFDIIHYVAIKVAPFKKIRRLEFVDLPSEGDERASLIALERDRRLRDDARLPFEYWEEDERIILNDSWVQFNP